MTNFMKIPHNRINEFIPLEYKLKIDFLMQLFHVNVGKYLKVFILQIAPGVIVLQWTKKDKRWFTAKAQAILKYFLLFSKNISILLHKKLLIFTDIIRFY